MEWTKWPALLGLVAGTAYATLNIPTSFAFDKPVHTSIVVLASVAVLVLCLSRLLPRSPHSNGRTAQYSALPLEAIRENGASREHSPHGQDIPYPSSLRKIRIIFLVLVTAICLRVETIRQIIWNVQCTRGTLEPLVPLVLAGWDYWRVQLRKRKQPLEDDMQRTVYDVLEHHLFHTPHRYVLAIGLVSFGCLIALRTDSSPYSTYICAGSLPFGGLVPVLQHLGTVLDIVILYCINKLLHEEEGRGHRSVALRFSGVGWALLASATILFGIGTIYYFASPDDRRWILMMPRLYVWSLVKLDVLACFVSACMLFTIFYVGVLTTSILMVFTSVLAATVSFAGDVQHPFPPLDAGLWLLATCVATLGFAAYFYIETVSEGKAHAPQRRTFLNLPVWFYLLMLSLIFICAGVWAPHKDSVTYHPISMLMWDAQNRHEAYVNQTSNSTNLAEAVVAYTTRYHKTPPPNFDKWYEYATARNSVVIDNYDRIHQDLLPFYALSPADIRQRTWEMIANPWNDAAGISIRRGKVAISPNVMPTHRWMLDGLVEMIGNFAEWLPDMDLAFNLNDECRVAVPFEDIEPMRQIGLDFTESQKPNNAFDNQREQQWTPIPEEPITETPLKELSWQRTFYDFGSVGCHPSSPARTQHLWDNSGLCISCTYPQSLGPFLANWTLAADVCHQPDLADLHGIYLSPAAFKGAHSLYPIFSQSKTHGFADILYPSAWNYIDKAVYAPSSEHPDPPFLQKNTTLFWRGATSEGVSQGKGQWRGMTRQRFVHLANNINNTNPPQAILLPSPEKPANDSLQKYHYAFIPTSQLIELVQTDVHVVQSIARCGGRDCAQQALEFAPLVPPTDFQSHWSYKYLLDLDGAGFSGRFLPFLHSHSLPFKSGLFREWWDDRVTPWVHFVPLDVRGQGFWATLVYFAGLEGRVEGREVLLEAHERDAELIAEKGRGWAGKVLRKEDMEIYFFRLLLEWGLVTDDGREGIGFSGEAG